MSIIFQICLLIITSATILVLDSISQIYGIAIIITIINVVIQFSKQFKGHLLFVWQVAFLYIIAIEGFIYADEIVFSSGSNYLLASKYLVITYFFSVISYLCMYITRRKTHISTHYDSKRASNERSYGMTLFSSIFIVLLYLIFLIINYDVAISALYGGRLQVLTYTGPLYFLLNPLNNAIGMILPAIITFSFKYGYKFKNYKMKSIILTFPIYIILFLLGTRFTLLFSVIGLFTIILYGTKLKKLDLILAILFGILFIFSAEVMKNSRGIGFYNYIINGDMNILDDIISLFYSREGITVANAMLIDYFKVNSHLLGLQTSFIFYFWIPRILWRSKPTMLGYWLIREVRQGGYGAGHSISFGFAGDAYADFGFLGGIIFAVAIGVIFFSLEKLRLKADKIDVFNYLYTAVLFPFAFFAMRSFQTSLFSSISMLIILYLFKKSLKKNKVYKDLDGD